MSYIKISEILKRRGKVEPRVVPIAMQGARIKVLIGSCSHCAKLRDNVAEAAKQLDIPDSDIEVITDLSKIARYGVMTTPALFVDGKPVSIGKVLSVEQVLPLLAEKKHDDAE